MNPNDQTDRPEAGIILHREGVIIDLDHATAAMFGYERSEIIGRGLQELIPEYEKYATPSSIAGGTTASPTIGTITPESLTEEDAPTTFARKKQGDVFEVAIERWRRSLESDGGSMCSAVG